MEPTARLGSALSFGGVPVTSQQKGSHWEPDLQVGVLACRCQPEWMGAAL